MMLTLYIVVYSKTFPYIVIVRISYLWPTHCVLCPVVTTAADWCMHGHMVTFTWYNNLHARLQLYYNMIMKFLMMHFCWLYLIFTSLMTATHCSPSWNCKGPALSSGYLRVKYINKAYTFKCIPAHGTLAWSKFAQALPWVITWSRLTSILCVKRTFKRHDFGIFALTSALTVQWKTHDESTTTSQSHRSMFLLYVLIPNCCHDQGHGLGPWSMLDSRLD